MLRRLTGVFVRSTLSANLFRVQSCQLSASLDTDFEQAKSKLNSLAQEPGNDVKLQIYALFKQATAGQCTTSKPSAFDFVGKAKWDVWNKLGSMSKEDAKKEYVKLIDGLAGSSAAKPSASAAASSTAAAGGAILEEKDGKIYRIKLNRPDKKNALTRQMYEAIGEALKHSAQSDSAITVLSGAGEYFCSGNDLSNFANVDPSTIVKAATEAKVLLQNYVGAFIDHPKPLIALVHGPAIGISVTVLGLCDAVYASDKSTFHTPFTSLGQSPEGCSSYTFPRLMGAAKASEVLLFGKKLTAEEACRYNLVTEVFPHAMFAKEVEQRLKRYSELPPQSLQLSKKVVRDALREELHRVNKSECELLEKRWQSDECLTAIMNFFSRKSNL